MKIFELEQTKAIQILFFLNEHEEVLTTEIMDGVSVDHRTLNRAMKNLTNLELVENEYRKGQPTKRVIWITEKGRKVASLLKEVETIL